MGLSKLRKIKHNEIERFTLKGTLAEAKVVSVGDGDTCDVVFKFKEKLEGFKCRLLGYDAYELKKEHKKAKLARDYLAHLCTGGDPKKFDASTTWTKTDLQDKLDESKYLLYAASDKFDGFGRALVTLKNPSGRKSINDIMMKSRYVKTRKQASSKHYN